MNNTNLMYLHHSLLTHGNRHQYHHYDGNALHDRQGVKEVV